MNKNVKIALIVVACIAVVALVCFVVLGTGNGKSKTNTAVTNNAATNTNSVDVKEKGSEGSMYSSGLHHATIVVKDFGTIKLELDADTAPITVANFAKLVNEGFYNGLTFHRIISGFMIQGGSENGTSSGGNGETIKGEFLANGVKNNISHVRGTISMARPQIYDGASTQFFIMHKDKLSLDGLYAGFGHVTEGIEVVDKICEMTPVEDNNGTVLFDNQPVIESITMND